MTFRRISGKRRRESHRAAGRNASRSAAVSSLTNSEVAAGWSSTKPDAAAGWSSMLRSVKKSWFQKNVYEWDPYFKFPNRIIATVVLSFLGIYMIVLTEQIISSWLIMTLYGPWRSSINIFVNESSWILHLDYGTYTWYITSACAMLSSVIHVSHVLMYYRKHIKSLWAGDKKYLPKKSNLRPAVSVAGLLKYPGYQIAFTMWGYLIIHMAMFTAGMLFVYLVISPIREDGFLSWLLKLLTFLPNFFILFTLMKFQIIVIRLCFLQDKNWISYPQDKEKPLALKNRPQYVGGDDHNGSSSL
ncbi:stimulated by retinoic acid gene 6 protein-like [Silurus meridionalis]|uniref:stimulated by retinoic acid gene 6 protein-like n=1 Tax=Silurus meridionalis TaxID=175797 RepID=UPI001EEBE2B3|nr:stimulated by retinoic acid gene 6 protein-like [Silurus meridionalis]